jgi:energy-converting hydrogenase Eha subunit G
MVLLSVIVTIGGLCFAFVFPFFIPGVLEAFFFELTGTGFETLAPGEVDFHNLLSGVIGGTMCGWGLLLALLSKRLMRRQEDWIWAAVALSVLGWFLVDGIASALARSTMNLLLNSAILLAALPPLVVNRRRIASGLRELGGKE